MGSAEILVPLIPIATQATISGATMDHAPTRTITAKRVEAMVNARVVIAWMACAALPLVTVGVWLVAKFIPGCPMVLAET